MPEISQHSLAEELAMFELLNTTVKRANVQISAETAATIEGCALALALMQLELDNGRITPGTHSFLGRQLVAVANFRIFRELPVKGSKC